jgi:hypothetical protein
VAQLKAPYIKLLDERGDINMWIVDGIFIRNSIDEEFTNYGQHYRFPYIPKDEFWLDREAAQNEQQFFIDHLLLEHRLMEKGMSYDKALDLADHAERKERRLAGDLAHFTRHGGLQREATQVHEQFWTKVQNGASVWIVNGRSVRSLFDIDFTEGGHDKVYKFVPENEVWIDDDVEKEERGYVLLHELHERNLMLQGIKYNKAHAESSRLEYRCRHYPNELTGALKAEGCDIDPK